MSGDLGVLEVAAASAHGLRSLDVHILILDCIEALSPVGLQAALLATSTWYGLDEANHGLGAHRVEAAVVSRVDFNRLKSLRLSDGVRGQSGLRIVPEIGQVAESIVQLHLHCLIVDSGPSAVHGLSA